MTTKHQVLALFDAEPTLSSQALADRLDCTSSYVRATLKRNGRTLAFSHGDHSGSRLSPYEICAKILRDHGLPEMAEKILAERVRRANAHGRRL